MEEILEEGNVLLVDEGKTLKESDNSSLIIRTENQTSDDTMMMNDNKNGISATSVDDQIMEEVPMEGPIQNEDISTENGNQQKNIAEISNNVKNNSQERCEDDSESLEDSTREIIGDLEIDIPDPASTPGPSSCKEEALTVPDEEMKPLNDHEEEQKPVKMKVINMTELGCCEYCGGPVKKRRLCSPLKRFCSKACARSFRKPKKRDDESGQDSEESGGTEGESKMTWDDYLEAAYNKAAPDSCFKHSTTDVPGLKPGMKLEAVDRNNPPSFCVATVIKCVGHRVCIRYDGYGADSSNDVWCNFQAEELHPIGWCALNGYPLQPPKGVGSNLEDWRTFLTQTLTGALAAPQDLFRKSQEIFQPRVHGFEVGMKLEAVHPLKPSIICPATVTKSLGPYYFAITPDFQHDLPTTTVCCHSDSPGIFPVGWCYRNGMELTFPANYTKKTFSWEKYLTLCRASAAPAQLFKQKVKAHKFKVGMKVEAVDLERPCVVCVATVTNLTGRLLQLFFDGQSRFQFVDVESPDIYPISWCRKTSHPLFTPFGVMPQELKVKAKPLEIDPLHLPSFDEVMGRQPSSATTTSVAIIPRKPIVRGEKDKEKEKDEEDLDDKSGESDISEDDSLASERFYHNKNQIFFNKSCCIGPLLDPDKVALLPDATTPGKVSTVIRIGLEIVAKASHDPEKVIDLMQEGCGVRVVVRHKGKLLKKAISRVDSRPKLERYLKRFCRRLICCEYFLSLKPVGQPCPDQCKADEQGNLQGPKGLKAKRSREYFEVKHLGLEKKKRGRKRKSELLEMHNTDGSALVKKVVTENGVTLPVTPVHASAIRNRQLAPGYHLQQNGTVVNRTPVATGALPGVQAPVVRYQGPSSVAVVRPSINPQLAPRARGPAIAPAPTPRLIATLSTVQGTATLVKQEAPFGQNRTLVMSELPGGKKPRVSGIVTNISGQRFATSSSGGGTTITFGRAPPNVTICNSTVPPPLLTRITNTTDGINVRVPPSVGPGVTMATTSGHVTHSRGPPNVVVSGAHGVITSGGAVQVSISEGSGGASVGGVIRAPIVVPPQVKHDTPPPPPLLHTAKAPPGSRIQGRPTGVPDVSLSVAFNQSRPGAPSNYPGHPGGPRSPRPLYTVPAGNSPGGPPPLAMASQPRTSFVRAEKVHHTVTTTVSHRPIIPNYQGFTQGVSPRPQLQGIPHGNAPGTIKIPVSAAQRRQVPLSSTGGQTTRTIIGNIQAAKPGVIQTIHHNPAANASMSNPRPIAMKSMPPNVSFVTTATKVRTAPNVQPTASDPVPNNSETDPRACKEEERKKEGEEKKENNEEQGEETPEVPKKRNLWWLKKRRRKRSRLTYMKAKYRRKDDDDSATSRTVKGEPMEQERAGSPERPKRGRPATKDLVLRLRDEGEGAFSIGDEGDPDWDESFERKKIKQPMRRRRGTGRMRTGRDTGGELSPSLPNPPTPYFSSSPPSLANNPYVRRVGSRLVATMPPDSSPIPMKTSPGAVRSSLSAEMPGNKPTPMSEKNSRALRPASYPASDVQGLGLSTAQYPPPSAIRSSSRPLPLSPRSPLHSRPAGPKKLVSVGTNTSLPGCLNGRSPDLPSNPVSWTVDEVVLYVRSTDCTSYSTIFQEEEIDGQAMMMLSRDALMQFTPMKLGPTLKMCSYIAQLKLRAR